VDGDGGDKPEEPDTGRGKPEAFAGLRWEQAPPVIVSGFRGGWRAWLTGSPSARRVARCLAVAETAGIAVAVTLIAASLVRGGPAGGTGVLWVPGILLLAAGQVWAILVIKARQPPGRGRLFLIQTGQSRSISRDLRAYFGPLDRRVTRTASTRASRRPSTTWPAPVSSGSRPGYSCSSSPCTCTPPWPAVRSASR